DWSSDVCSSDLRWWNVKHPARYAERLSAGVSPAAGREVLTEQDRHVERVMLELRLSRGLPLDALDKTGRRAGEEAVSDGLLEPGEWAAGRAVLTLRGRLLADGVVRRLLG